MATQLSIAYQQLLNDRRKTQEQIRSDKMNERINLQRNALDYKSKIYAADSSNEASKYGSFMGYAGKVYSSDKSYQASVYSADKSLESAKVGAKGRTDSAKISAEASKYGADRSFEATKYKTDKEAEMKAADREVSWYNAHTSRAESQSNIRKNAAQTNLFNEQARQTSYVTDTKLPAEVSKTKAETLNTQARTRSTDAATFTGLLPNATHAARIASDAAKATYLAKEFGNVYNEGPESVEDIESMPDVINATTDYWLGDGRQGHNIISDTKTIAKGVSNGAGQLINAVGTAINNVLKPHWSDSDKNSLKSKSESLRETDYQAFKNNVLSGFWYPPEAFGDKSFVERFYKEVPNYGKK